MTIFIISFSFIWYLLGRSLELSNTYQYGMMMLRDRTLAHMQELSKDDHDYTSKVFFTNLLQVVRGVENEGIYLFDEISKARTDIAPSHLCWILFASFQYVTNCKFDYLSDGSDIDQSKLKAELKSIIVDRTQEIQTLCINNNVSTNVADRYKALQIIMSMYDKSEPINVLDVGCSYGVGLMSLNTNMMNNSDIDCRLLNYFSNRRPNANFYGVDIFEPNFDWLVASSFPEYGKSRRVIREELQTLSRQGSTFDFAQCDITSDNIHGFYRAGMFDIIWTSNLFYELEGDMADSAAHENIYKLLGDNGIWVHAYYRSGQKAHISGDSDEYVACIYPKNDWEGKGYEALVAKDKDKAEKWIQGRDFKGFFGSTDL